MYAKIKDNELVQYSYTLGNLQTDNPFTNYGDASDVAAIFPTTEAATLRGYELVEVVIAEMPTHDPDTHRLEQGSVTLVNGQWTVGWNVVALTTEELLASDAVARASIAARAKLELQETDWCENASVRNAAVDPHLTNASAFDAYRLALRVITLDPPVKVASWPVRPSAVWTSA